MHLAWAASLIAQAILAVVLWFTGRRDRWTLYLFASLLISALRWQFDPHTHAYWYVHTATEPIILALQFMAVGQASSKASRDLIDWALIIGAGAALWSLVFTSEGWPLMRRAGLLMRQFGIFGCFAIMAAPLAVGKPTDRWMTVFFFLESARLVAEQITIHQTRTVDTAHLSILAVFFMAWAIYRLMSRAKS